VSAVPSEVAGQRFVALGVFIALAWGAGAIGGQFAPDDWYARLHKPLITPPNEVFGVVWPVLYTLTGVSAWLAWDARRRLSAAHGLWLLHLGLTALWPYLFFGLHQIHLALATLILLLLVMLGLMAAFWRIRPPACALQVPYFGWLLFAALLNVAFAGLN
jgi:tryptophan-rich sensory protein